MDVRKAVIAILVIIALYSAYRGVSCAFQSDRDLVIEAMDTLTRSFADGDLSSILGCLSEDFEVVWRRETLSREELADHLRILFFQGGRIILTGGIQRLDMEPDGDKDRAHVEWEGEAREKGSGVGRYGGDVYRGTGNLTFRREGGSWLLAAAEMRGRR